MFNQHYRKVEQCLRINIKEDPASLDPRRGREMSCASQLHAMLFEGLMRLEADGSLVCAQARSYELSADKRTYTFYLRDSLWSDGTPVTAYDFEKTWKDILDPHFPSMDAHALFCILNAKEAKCGNRSRDEIGIYALDAKTLVVVLERPVLYFLHLCASSVLFPINQTQEQQFPNWYLNAGEHFVSNGPFKLSVWERNTAILLDKNKYYHQADKIKIDAIQLSMIDNGTATLHMYASGLFDIVGMPFSSLPFDSYQGLMQENLFHLVQAPGTVVSLFNTQKFPFNNVNMRKAFSYALNRQLLVDQVTLLKEQPALGAVPPMLKNNQRRAFFKDCDGTQARLAFQKGLQELGITASALTGKISFSYWKHDHGCPMLPLALQQQWQQELGIKVELESFDFKTLHDRGKKGLFSMGYFVFFSMYFEGEIEVLDRFKYAVSTRNYARWENENYQRLLDRSAHSDCREERRVLLDQAEEILMDEMPFAPIFYWNYALLVQPYIKGFAVSPLGYFCFDRFSIEKRRKRETLAVFS